MFKRILLIDDDPGIHALVDPLLTSEGYMVTSARTGEHGLQLALSGRPHLIVLDVIMPGIKGRELCVKMKAYDVLKDIPVVFLTAKDSPDDIEAEMAAGAVAHVTKPIEPQDFVGIVKSIIGPASAAPNP